MSDVYPETFHAQLPISFDLIKQGLDVLVMPDVRFLLAQLPPPDSTEAVGWIVLTFFGLAAGFYYVLMCWQALFPKKSPPDHDVWATKVELARLELDHKGEMRRIEQRFSEWISQQDKQHEEKMDKWDQWHKELVQWQLLTERALGTIGTKAEFANAKKPGAR